VCEDLRVKVVEIKPRREVAWYIGSLNRRRQFRLSLLEDHSALLSWSFVNRLIELLALSLLIVVVEIQS
jgi:hypothetical protein